MGLLIFTLHNVKRMSCLERIKGRSKTSSPARVFTQPSVQLVQWREGNHSPPSSVRVKNEWSYTSA